jgi:hypothetical protein
MKTNAGPGAEAFTGAERVALWELRVRYRTSGDLFGRQELARLRFVRWLYRTGRLTASARR